MSAPPADLRLIKGIVAKPRGAESQKRRAAEDEGKMIRCARAPALGAASTGCPFAEHGLL
jgi:hypothetical protein